MDGNLPGQSLALCGQPSQVAACGSHSAGMRKPLIGQKPVFDAAVRVGATVPEEWPVTADLLDPGEVDLRHDDALLLSRLRDDDAERIRDKGVTPELDAGALPVEPLEADPVRCRHPAAVRD